VFLSSLATARQVSASTQNQALAALLFLYAEVLERKLQWMNELVRAKRPERLPLVLTRAELRDILQRLDGPTALVAGLLYGSGLRLLEALELRVRDLDLEKREIHVRVGKGRKDRRTMIPLGTVTVPDAIAVKYASAPREWRWQSGLPPDPALPRARHGPVAPAPSARDRHPAGHPYSCYRCQHRQGRHAAHAEA
jgi:integrase